MQIVAIRGKEDGADFLMMNQIAVIWCILIMLYKKGVALNSPKQ